MDVMEVLKKRRSIRAFEDKEIDTADLEAIVEAGSFAPTARNIQPWKFVIVRDKKVLKEIAQLAENGRFIADSMACIALFCEETKYYLEDGCAATANILNAAVSLGIGSCWVAGDKKPYCPQISKLLAAPSGLKLVSLIALGYPQDKDAFHPVDRKPLKEILHWEKF